MDWSDILERAGWTALQAALGALPATISVAVLTSADAWKAIGLTVAAAAIGALISFGKNVVKQRLAAD